MVTIITKNSSTSCRSARRWLDNHDIDYEEINISRHPFKVTRDILIQILSLEEEGLSALYGRKKKTDPNYQWLVKSIEELSLESALSFLQNHMELLCTPIIFDEKRVQLGYDSENIRKFIPKEKRRVDARRKMSQLREMELMVG